MTDIIEQAVSEWEDETEREAFGEVQDKIVRLVKTEYEIEQRGPTAWKVAVYVDDDSPLSTKSVKELSANEAQAKFEELVEKHNLQEQQ